MSRFKTLSTENTEMPGQSYIPTHQLFSSLFCDDKESGKWSISHEIDEAMLSSSMCLFNILYYDRLTTEDLDLDLSRLPSVASAESTSGLNNQTYADEFLI